MNRTMRRLLIAAGMALALPGCTPAPVAAPPADGAPQAAGSHEPATILAALRRLPEYSVLSRLLTETGRSDILAGPGPVTFFAPRDTAFAQLNEAQRAALSDPAQRDATSRTLDMLIVPEFLRGDELKQRIATGGGSATLTARAGSLTVTLAGDEIVVTAPNGLTATAGTQEIATGNGAVYVLDHWPGAAPQPAQKR